MSDPVSAKNTLVDMTNLPGLNAQCHVSQEMIAEEEKLEIESSKSRESLVDSEHKYEPEDDEKRFTCFKKLLKHSEAYTEYLREKMATQVNMRRLEKTRKFSLMRQYEPKYVEKGISCEQFITDKKVDQDESDTVDPQTILEGKMLNVVGEIVSMQQPFMLENAVLRPYQVEGLLWLKVLFENGVNGILADEMGLGKTIQCISVIAHLCEMGIKGPFLIVAPLSTLSNWLNEFQRFAPKIPVILYHGMMEHRAQLQRDIKLVKFLDLEVFPVVLTSYEIAMKDRPFLQRFQWKYLVIDEGHRIKNHNCRLVRELKRLNAMNRLLLTGTPLQNNLTELWALMNFLLPEVFGDLQSFEMWFNPEEILDNDKCNKIIQLEKEQQFLETMHRILRPFLLRRVKTEVEINLPPKKEVLVYAPLTMLQESYYRETLSKTIRKWFGIPEGEDADSPPLKRRKSAKNVYCLRSNTMRTPSPKKRTLQGITNIKLGNVTMQLRKIVNHPYLLHHPLDPDTQLCRADDTLVDGCGKMLVLDAMLSRLREHGHRVLLFSQMTQMMDILEDYCILRNYEYCRLDGTMGFEQRQTAIDDFTNQKIFIFLLSTRAGGLGINLTAADTVIIYDSDWNPQVDLQAMDRCHRIGQTKPVVVYRLVAERTIDEDMVIKASGKKKLEMMIIEKGKFKEKREKVAGISVEELQDLLNYEGHDVCMQPNGYFFSDEELDLLMDRRSMFSTDEEKSSNESRTKERTSSKVKSGPKRSPRRKSKATAEKENKPSKNKQKLYTILED